MKKNLLSFALILFTLCLVMTALSSCSKKEPNENDTAGDTALESGTIDSNDHLSSGSGSGTVIFTDTESESPSGTEALPPDEGEETDQNQPEKIENSLKFLSYGNGTCAVSGIGDYKEPYIIIPEKSPSGDIVTAIESKAFFENTSIKTVKIPSTVTYIGDLAFGGCNGLIHISVDAANKAFSDVDGVLYSKDRTCLILFPGSSQAAEISISVTVEKIDDMAFYNCPYLKSIKYGGTLKNWNNIKIGDNNYGLYSASISFATNE